MAPALLLSAATWGQRAGEVPGGHAASPLHPVVGQASSFAESQPLASIPARPAVSGGEREAAGQGPDAILPKVFSSGASDGRAAEAVLQSWAGSSAMPAPLVQWEGISNRNSVYPPDTEGDVGPSHFIQWVNTSFAIWDKAGALLFGPVDGNALWQTMGGPCYDNNDGDPIVLYDNLADRWVVSQFALVNATFGPYYQAIAVSKTPDPLGAWYLYCFKVNTTKMNDYPKFGVWPDGYYMTVNQFQGGSWAGAGVYVFDRAKMLAGDPTATFQYFDVGSVDLNYGGMLPSHTESLWMAPSAGTPNYILEVDDGGWIPGYANDALRIWECKVDWATPANSTLGLPGMAPDQILDTASWTPLPCVTGGVRSCIPQPGTTQRLDSLGDRLMYRLNYRNHGAYASMAVNHTVWADGTDRAGVRWYELRKSGSSWAIHQQGTFAPADSHHRWMGSAAMDHSGNLAIGYSVSSPTVSPSIRYAGRLASDPAGELSQGEAEIIAGSGSQTGGSARWGDYSTLSVDPTDDCTFWYTQEYMVTTSPMGWQTRIASFKFPGCGFGAVGSLAGTVTASGTGLPLKGVAIQATDGVVSVQTSTASDGTYSLTLPPATYQVAASAYGYDGSTASAVVVVSSATTTQDFSLTATPSHVVSGVVTDQSTGWPLYASIQITGYPGDILWNDPVTGFYSIPLLEHTSYTLHASSWVGGYGRGDAPITLSTGDLTQNIQLTPDLNACDAPGYALQSTPLLEQDFDSLTPPALPAGWSSVRVAGSNSATAWKTHNDTVHPASGGNHSGATLVYFNSYSVTAGNNARLELDSVFDFSAGSGLVSFWMFHDTGYSGSADRVQVQVSTDGGTTWQNAGSAVARNESPAGWRMHSVQLAGYAGPSASVRVGLLGISQYGNDVHLDDLRVVATSCSVPATGGLVVGNVYDANTGLALTGAAVTNGASAEKTTASATLDASVDDAFFTIYSSGSDTLSASNGALYSPLSHSPAVAPGATVLQDFSLDAGRLAASPPSVALTLNAGESDMRVVNLVNSGNVPASFSIFELSGESLPTGPFQRPDAVVSVVKQNLSNARALSLVASPAAPPYAAGDVIQSWPTHLSAAWGLAFDGYNHRVWVGSPQGWGGDNTMVEFTGAGEPTGRSHPFTWTPSSGPADFAFDWRTGRVWVMNVASGVSNCIYEMDPAEGFTGTIVCPGGGAGFEASQRGLACDPATDTFYAGSWNDSMVHHFSSDGTLLSSVNVGLAIAGLAYNPSTQHLFAMVSNSPSQIYVLDAADNYALLGQFAVSGFAPWGGSGMDMDCDGHLWIVDQTTETVLEVESGESASLCGTDMPWLLLAPSSGTVPAGSSSEVHLIFDASGLAPATYRANLKVGADTPYAIDLIPVEMTVQWPPMTATAAADVTSGQTPLAVQFSGSAAGGDGGPYTYDWNFGDGSLHSTAKNPSHVYDTAGNHDVTLAASDAHGHSASDNHLVIAATSVPPPSLTSLSPSNGSTAGGTTVVIAGSHFTGATLVRFGAATAVFTVDGDAQITATSPAHPAGLIDVTVTTPYGTSAIVAADRFTFVAPPAVTGLSPTSGPASGGTPVAVTGSAFSGATAVRFGGTPSTSFSVASDGLINAQSPAHASGEVAVTVTTPYGTSPEAPEARFTFVPPPSLSSVTPDKGTTAGGTPVILAGAHFQSGAAVTFGSTGATATVISDSQISLSSPPHGAGTVDITVTNPDGQSATLTAAYTYVEPPVISSVAKLSAPLRLKILGSNFHNPCTIKIDGAVVPAYKYKNDTTLVVKGGAALKALIPKGVTVQVTVTNDDDGATSLPYPFAR